MPPSRHSSSSHPSSRSSSSRSSSSRSSSSRSSSSHSSSSRSSFGSSRSYSSRGPSSHSSTSHSSRQSYAAPAPKPAPQPVHRPRVNQPVGFLISQMMRPTYYYGRRHDYVYYPESWTDTESGRYYEKGYYDENGQFYDSVAFQKNGKYENVVCRCAYCGTETVMNLDNRAGSTQSLQCPACGAPMEIKSELDEVLDQPAENTHVYDSEASLSNAFGQPKKKKGHGLFIAVAIALCLLISSSFKNALYRSFHKPTIEQPSYQQQIAQPDYSSGTNSLSLNQQMIYLEKQEDGSYHVVTDPIRADRFLPYEEDSDSYYDETSDCWLWYNTDVEPAIWQYWYEGISSDYGDYGWMEYDSDGWWIETEEGEWIPLPAKYNTGGLWYIS